ncbi:MAG TPA: hypothetical protein VIC57_01420 [Candidatus Dormibacteraeota bacterium]
MNQTLTILSPVPDGPVAAGLPDAAPELPAHVRVGLLSNGKPNTEPLFDGVLDVLGEDPRFALALRVRKASASQPAPAEILERLAGEADLVIGATAD